MPDKLSDQQKFRRLMQWAARAQSLYGDDELEQFAEEYWHKRGVNYRNLYENHTVEELLSLEVIDGEST